METTVVVQLISVIGAVITAGIAAWATVLAARINAAKSNPAPPPLPAAGPTPAAPPPLPPPTAEKPPVSTGWRTGLWVAAVVFVLAAVVSNNQQPATPQMGTGCYDQWGNRRCDLPYPAPVGTPCGCPGQGMGVVGP